MKLKQREEHVRVNRIRFVKWDDGFAQGNKMKDLGTYAVELCYTIQDAPEESTTRTASRRPESAGKLT